MTPHARVAQKIEPAVGDEEWRQRQRQNRHGQDGPPPASAHARQPERRDGTKSRCRQRRQATDQQAVFEQRPAHLRKIALSFAVVLSRSASNRGQSTRSVGPEAALSEKPSSAPDATSRALTSRRCRYSNRICPAC